MIKEIPLEKSEIYKMFYKDSKWPIKADSLLMMDDVAGLMLESIFPQRR